ncbi:MAG: hypothetical protein ACJAX5_001082 [Patiriisocius sp.]
MIVSNKCLGGMNEQYIPSKPTVVPPIGIGGRHAIFQRFIVNLHHDKIAGRICQVADLSFKGRPRTSEVPVLECFRRQTYPKNPIS